MNRIIISFLIIVAFLALVAIIFVSVDVVNRAQKTETPEVIHLEEGAYPWAVYSGGSSLYWNLAYSSYDDIPIKNNDYGRVVEYKGNKYFLLRVYPGQLQVSEQIK